MIIEVPFMNIEKEFLLPSGGGKKKDHLKRGMEDDSVSIPT